MKRNIIWIAVIVVIQTGCIQIESSDEKAVVKSVDKIESKALEDAAYEVISLFGNKLSSPELVGREKRKREHEYDLALINFNSNPDSLEYIIWYGRRLSSLYRYNDAINVFSEGIKKFPESYKLYRHRGHRFLTIRNFDRAIQDLEKAVFYSRNVPIEMERDALPNKKNVPRNSVQYKIWYHLGLAYYMQGNFDKSVSAYKKCISIADNDDMLVAATDWLYMTYRKTGNLEFAEGLLEPISRHMHIIENSPYHQRLLMYKGERSPERLFDLNREGKLTIDQLTMAYGVGNWYYYNGESEKALAIFEKMIESSYWQAFGYIAAEVELVNLQQPD